MILLSWMNEKPLLRLSKASLARIRAREREKALEEEADKRHAQQDLNTKP